MPDGQSRNRAAGILSRSLLLTLIIGLFAPLYADEKKDDKKKNPEKHKITRLTQGMGLYTLGPVSADGKSLLLIARKPEAAPNLYVMDLTDFSIRPPLTSFKWGAGDPRWSPDGKTVALAGSEENASFSELYLLDLKTAKTRRMTANNFSDKEPVFTPDGKRVLYTTDESPLPDAAFGILHVASIPVEGGKGEAFTEDEGQSIMPGIAPDQKSVLLVKVSEASGRHSLWQYSFDGKPQRDLTELKFARIHRYIPNAATNSIILWAQEQAEQQESIFILDFKTGQARELPEPDLPKRNPAVSPDGKLIAFLGPTATGRQLFLYDTVSGQIQQLTFKGINTNSPVFISDQKILFGSDRDKENEIFLIDLATPLPEENKKKD
ncbi:MAG TPA: hypothetical protein VNO70_21095 [Blastocatellia bacterium]|nr:hypothetical protein [Blastocatellia bacterium]